MTRHAPSRQTRIARGDGVAAVVLTLITLWYLLVLTAVFLGVVALAKVVF